MLSDFRHFAFGPILLQKSAGRLASQIFENCGRAAFPIAQGALGGT